MECPSCKFELDHEARLCPRCRLAVRRAGAAFEPVYPDIRVGARLYAVDLRNERPVAIRHGDHEMAGGALRMSQVRDGLLVAMTKGKAYLWTNPYTRQRDVCVRVAVMMLDPSALVYAVARSEAVGAARSEYGMAVSARRRAARLFRMLTAPKQTIVTPLGDWVASDAIAPVGGPNEVELRVQGPTLEGRVNGQRLVVQHDAVLGFGRAGIRFEAEADAASDTRVIWWGFDNCAVAA